MRITLSELKATLRLLGPRGFSAGLKASDIPIEELRVVAKSVLANVSESSTREQIIEAVIEEISRPGLKPIDELMRMGFSELSAYFDFIRVSNEELLKLLDSLNYKVSSEDRKSLRKFAARQISETARFSRVASRNDG